MYIPGEFSVAVCTPSNDLSGLAPNSIFVLSSFPICAESSSCSRSFLSSAGNPQPHLNILPLSGISESAQAHDQLGA